MAMPRVYSRDWDFTVTRQRIQEVLIAGGALNHVVDYKVVRSFGGGSRQSSVFFDCPTEASVEVVVTVFC